MRDEMLDWGRKPHKIKTIYNSVDPEYLDYKPGDTRFRGDFGIPPERPAAGMIASFRPRKGAEYLISAMPAVLERVPDAVLFMIGHGEWVSGKDYIDELKTLAESKGVSESVIFTGFRSDIPQVVSELDVMILPSIYGEGSSLTLLEAMGLACPAIASATEGNIELIEDGVTGLLVPPADAGALSKAIITILEDRNKAKQMGEAARQKVIKEFLADRMAGSYTEVFEGLFEERLAGRGTAS
jgi:glycosyltransferase involved in cell wall biosynthesis